jgi:1-acyl-sn-glycerol-3-phosphate acyltransferase
LIYGFLGVPIKWVMKAGISKIPLVGAACRAAGFIFVDNSTRKAATRSITEAEQCLRNGASVFVFPEGSRTYDGKMIRFKKGAFQMAVDQHLQIVPITLNGPFNVVPIGSLNIHRHPMELVIHPPVSTIEVDESNKELQQLADATQQIIASALWEKYK